MPDIAAGRLNIRHASVDGYGGLLRIGATALSGPAGVAEGIDGARNDDAAMTVRSLGSAVGVPGISVVVVCQFGDGKDMRRLADDSIDAVIEEAPGRAGADVVGAGPDIAAIIRDVECHAGAAIAVADHIEQKVLLGGVGAAAVARRP